MGYFQHFQLEDQTSVILWVKGLFLLLVLMCLFAIVCGRV